MRLEFDSYQLFFYAKPYQHRFIQLFHEDKQVGSLTFDDYQAVPENTASDDSINLKFHESDYRDIVDLLRNEAPLFIWINTDNGIGGLSTSPDEFVGEAE
ncbi:MAG: hypothetical protein GYB31_03845 [Bacteroidetes bacterium]|nr:hypothetical protein [Bacteroidota bacterium]